MALHTLGTAATTSLTCLPAWSQTISQADVAGVGQSIASDTQFGTILGTGMIGPKGIIATGSTHSNTTLDTLVAVSGGGLATIHIGDLVLGAGIPAATTVKSITSGTAVVLSAAATATAAGVNVAFVRNPGAMYLTPEGILTIPGGRGSLRVLPGDYVAVDLATGWPILVSGQAVAYAGSLWSFT